MNPVYVELPSIFHHSFSAKPATNNFSEEGEKGYNVAHQQPFEQRPI
jgi:hypothetical protein